MLPGTPTSCNCIHHFVLPPDRAVCWGTCKRCGLQRHFPSLKERCSTCRRIAAPVVELFELFGRRPLRVCQDCRSSAERRCLRAPRPLRAASSGGAR